MEIAEFVDTIDTLNGYTRLNPILEGYSSDGKYLVEKSGQNFLLRTFKPEEFARKSEEFAALKMMVERGVKCSIPIEMRINDAGQVAYMLLSYIDGADAEKTIPCFGTQKQYDLGFQAGIELLKINSCEAPNTIAAWSQRKFAKHQKYQKKYWEDDVRILHDKKIERFIEDNIFLMKDRPNRFQHDDFHIKNLVVNGNELAGIIDFGRFDWGDPVHEFLKVGQFSSEVSVPFSVGQIHGYFDGKDPDDGFWALYSLYLAMAIFSSVAWTKHVCPDEMPIMKRILERIITDHESFSEIRPRWYAQFNRN